MQARLHYMVVNIYMYWRDFVPVRIYIIHTYTERSVSIVWSNQMRKSERSSFEILRGSI